jgi:hypothetical protein
VVPVLLVKNRGACCKKELLNLEFQLLESIWLERLNNLIGLSELKAQLRVLRGAERE